MPVLVRSKTIVNPLGSRLEDSPKISISRVSKSLSKSFSM